MSSPVLQCPLCSKPFGVLPQQAGQAVQCPHCSQAVRIPSELPTVSVSEAESTSQTDTDVKFEPASIEHLLPPTFDVLDPQRLVFQNRKDTEHKIILPDGKGGLHEIDDRVVTVVHKGKEINLVSLPPEQLRRKRQIQNIIAILIGAIVLAIVLAILRKTA